MTDHEIHLALARFMGWTEIPSEPYQPIPRGSIVVSGDPRSEPMIWRGLAPQSTHEPWTPTTNPAQAVEVLIKAGDQWTAETGTCPKGAWATVTEDKNPYFRIGSEQRTPTYRPQESATERWCRSVCVAIVAAINDKPLPGDPK